MSENNLFQFAQVIAELPMQPNNNRNLPMRKNACVVCGVCFTCSKYYGSDCHCQEVQPRRGKNLPEGCLDSRAKKLHREDLDDFEFTVNWLKENANPIYKNEQNEIAGLRDLSEVSLCKAHSSTLYRAKKRHERNRDMMDTSPSPVNSPHPEQIYSNNNQTIGSGNLAAKVREISSQQYSQQSMPDLERMSPSASMKRRRTYKIKSPTQKPLSSMSTPLHGTSRIHPAIFPLQQQMDNFSSQLPPLQSRPIETSATDSTSTSKNSHSPKPTCLLPKQELSIPTVIETVSLKSSDDTYYFRNLAITDTFTFRDLLNEIDMIGTPPAGKRIVISDSERFYPLDQAIRQVIQRPTSTHLDLSLGLSDKPSINWSTYL